jgi:hypothetical protein
MKKIIIALLLIATIGGGIGFYMFNKPLESMSSMKSHFKMEAASLLEAFENDENSANAKYLDKVIEVKGSVVKIEEKDGNSTIYMEASNPLSNVIFQLENSVSGIKEGDQVTLKGLCTGYLMDVVMVRAIKI